MTEQPQGTAGGLSMGAKVGAVALVALVAGLFVDKEQFFRSYMFAYLFWLGLGLGSFALVMLHNLTGGEWGQPVRKLLESATRTIPLLGILFLPLLAGIGSLYEWSHADAVDHDVILQHKAPYLNTPFFIGRAVFYFAIWIFWSRAVLKLGAKVAQGGDEATRRRLTMMSSTGLVMYFVTMSFASFDWGMSLEPHWFSTIYGMHFVVGQVLAAFALVVLKAARLWRDEPFASAWPKGRFTDLGNLLLAFTMLWAYISFSQFLIIWSGNLPEETPWYLSRSAEGWLNVAGLLAIFHFGIPFLLLLRAENKRKAKQLIRIAIILLVMRVVDMFWLIAPAFHRDALHVSWLDPVAVIGLGGAWLFVFDRNVAANPPTAHGEPEADPGLKEAPAS
ncbi:MAG: hypothetical protein ACYTGN_16240 [Planctomycetota bacterium]